MPGRRVPKTERADRGHPGAAPYGGLARGVARIRLAQQQQVSQYARGHHTQQQDPAGGHPLRRVRVRFDGAEGSERFGAVLRFRGLKHASCT